MFLEARGHMFARRSPQVARRSGLEPHASGALGTIRPAPHCGVRGGRGGERRRHGRPPPPTLRSTGGRREAEGRRSRRRKAEGRGLYPWGRRTCEPPSIATKSSRRSDADVHGPSVRVGVDALDHRADLLQRAPPRRSPEPRARSWHRWIDATEP
ncbi:unnamed protein product, partial [Prorocentrum cordatum]